jgi:hypothetical protein
MENPCSHFTVLCEVKLVKFIKCFYSFRHGISSLYYQSLKQ